MSSSQIHLLITDLKHGMINGNISNWSHIALYNYKDFFAATTYNLRQIIVVGVSVKNHLILFLLYRHHLLKSSVGVGILIITTLFFLPSEGGLKIRRKENAVFY